MTVHERHDMLNDQAWLDDLRQLRLKYIEGHIANEEDINLDILTRGYPDTAHLVYELLQNMEDANASNAWFVLFDDSTQFEHDGNPFARDDVDVITTRGECIGRQQCRYTCWSALVGPTMPWWCRRIISQPAPSPGRPRRPARATQNREKR